MSEIEHEVSTAWDWKAAALRRLLLDFGLFSRLLYPDRVLRSYQVEAAGPVLSAIERGEAGEFTILFSRQSGKDELLAQLCAYLLARYRGRVKSVVMGAPTFRPQCVVSRRRLVARLETPLHRGYAVAEGYRVVVGGASVAFLSTDPTANARGETADLALIANEAQDTAPDRWDSVFAPMAASTNAPSVYSGTPWLAGSLLSRQTLVARERGTLYVADWERVAAEVPAYGEHVRHRMALLGERHPFILSEYGLQEVGSEGGLFPARRQAQMRAEHERRSARVEGRRYALLIDVAGEDEDQPDDPASRGREKRRDATALTVVEVDATDPRLMGQPVYRVVDRRQWVGVKHTSLYRTFVDLARNVWRASWVVVDATGVGAGLASFLQQALSPAVVVEPFVFSAKSKSDLGWNFLGLVESGRYKDYRDDGAVDTREFWAQVGTVQYTVQVGPNRLMRWSVPESVGHDDLVISAALSAVLDGVDQMSKAAVGYSRGLEWR